MPIYEYECTACGHRFERKQGFHEEPIRTCPTCQGGCRRVLHPAPIIFKGSGFYVTDSRPAERPELAATSAKAEPKTETKTEAKAETKTETKKGEGTPATGN